jgi:hypothetical protein
MVCEEIRELFSEYLDEVLDGPAKAALEAHLSSCEACRKELESLRSVLRELHSLEPVEPPLDFLAQLHERMEKRPWFQRVLRRLFFPLKVKIPLQLAGALAVVFLVFSVLLVQHPEYMLPARQAKLAAKVPMEQAKEGVIKGEAESRLSETEAARAPLVAAPPSPADERPAPPAARRSAPAAMKMKDANLRSMQEAKAVRRSDSAVDRALLEDRASVDLIVRMKKQKAEMAFSSAVTGTSREARPGMVAGAAKGMALRGQESKETDPAFRKVKHLIEKAQGKVLSVDYDKDTGEVDSVHAEIPASQYSTLYNGLSTLGDVQAPAQAQPKADHAPVELRVKVRAAE